MNTPTRPPHSRHPFYERRVGEHSVTGPDQSAIVARSHTAGPVTSSAAAPDQGAPDTPTYCVGSVAPSSTRPANGETSPTQCPLACRPLRHHSVPRSASSLSPTESPTLAEGPPVSPCPATQNATPVTLPPGRDPSITGPGQSFIGTQARIAGPVTLPTARSANRMPNPSRSSLTGLSPIRLRLAEGESKPESMTPGEGPITQQTPTTGGSTPIGRNVGSAAVPSRPRKNRYPRQPRRDGTHSRVRPRPTYPRHTTDHSSGPVAIPAASPPAKVEATPESISPEAGSAPSPKPDHLHLKGPTR